MIYDRSSVCVKLSKVFDLGKSTYFLHLDMIYDHRLDVKLSKAYDLGKMCIFSEDHLFV